MIFSDLCNLEYVWIIRFSKEVPKNFMDINRLNPNKPQYYTNKKGCPKMSDSLLNLFVMCIFTNY